MKKITVFPILLSLIFALASCGSSMESDAEKLAKLNCNAQNATEEQKVNELSKAAEFADKIKDKYEGEAKTKFEEAYVKYYANCK